MHIISVIISSYNAEKTLPYALDALEKQDIGKEKFEVIIIDDGSTDGSKKLIEQYIARNTLALYYVYQENAGVGIARNLGVQKAKGDILAFTDADCICDKNRLSTIEKSIRVEKKKLIGGYTYSNETIIFPRKMAPVNQQGITANLALNYTSIPKGYRLFDIGFGGMLGDDVDLVLSLQDLGIPLHYVPEMKVLHPANILTFERFLMRWKGRMNEVGLFKKHGNKTLSCFSPIFRPRILGRISLFTIGIVILIICTVIIIKLYGFIKLTLLLLALFIFFIAYGYKVFVIYQQIGHRVTLKERLKTLFYFLLTIPLFFIARLKGII